MPPGFVDATMPTDCPFCGGRLSLIEDPIALLHTLPTCETFDRLDPAAFVDAAIAKTVMDQRGRHKA